MAASVADHVWSLREIAGLPGLRRVARVYFQPFSLSAPEAPLTGWSAPPAKPSLA